VILTVLHCCRCCC